MIRRAVLAAAITLVALPTLSVGAVLGAKLHVEAMSARGEALGSAPDAVLVLGGTLASFASRTCTLVSDSRILTGLDYVTAHPDTIFAYSENLAGAAYFAEAYIAMNARAVGQPVPRRLLIEPNAISTFENMRLTAPLLAAEGVGRVAIVTDSIHMARALALWHHATDIPAGFIVATGPGEVPTDRLVTYVLREAAAWWFNLAKVAAWEALGLAGFDEAARGGLIR